MAQSRQWKVVIEEAMMRGQNDLLLMPEWISNSIQQWLDATRDQPVCLTDFVTYIGAVIGHPVSTLATEETLTADEVLVWMPSSVADAMGDLLADLRAGREQTVAEKWLTEKGEP